MAHWIRQQKGNWFPLLSFKSRRLHWIQPHINLIDWNNIAWNVFSNLQLSSVSVHCSRLTEVELDVLFFCCSPIHIKVRCVMHSAMLFCSTLSFIHIFLCISHLNKWSQILFSEQKDVLSHWRLGGNQFLNNGLFHNCSAFSHSSDLSVCLEQLAHLINHNHPSHAWLGISTDFLKADLSSHLLHSFLHILAFSFSFHSNSFHVHHILYSLSLPIFTASSSLPIPGLPVSCVP